MHRPPLLPALLLAALLWTAPVLAAPVNSGHAQSCADTTNGTETSRGANASRELCELIHKGVLPEMRLPDFSDQHRALEDFYKPAHYALAWTNEEKHPTGQALALIAAMENADRLGLRPEDYDASRWPARLAQLQSITSPAADLARLDLALTISVMRYVSDLYRGRLNPADFHFHWPAKECNTAKILREQLVYAKDVSAVLDHLQPPYPEYKRTLKALDDYISLAKAGESGALPVPAKPVWSGDIYAGAPQLAKRLQRLGDLPTTVEIPAGSDLYEDNLKNAIKHFQRRHGLNPDGSLEPDTFKQLTVPLERRILQLQLALEFWRWLPADLKAPWVLINVPEFRLRAFSDDQPPLSMSIVAGEAFKHQTPMFVDRLEYLIFRPAWHVPRSIQQKEIVPEIEKHPTYLASAHFQIFDNRGEVKNATLNSATLDKLRSGKLQLRQEPGSANELGLVKFVFPRQEGVYLHGTLDRDLFSRFRRDFSHGCIRLEDPAAFSAWMLHGNSRWNPASIDAAMNGNLTMKVDLPQPVTVVIFYGTAIVDENGAVNFSQDIYGYDAALEEALTKTRPY